MEVVVLVAGSHVPSGFESVAILHKLSRQSSHVKSFMSTNCELGFIRVPWNLRVITCRDAVLEISGIQGGHGQQQHRTRVRVAVTDSLENASPALIAKSAIMTMANVQRSGARRCHSRER
jgi:hypothetical protein